MCMLFAAGEYDKNNYTVHNFALIQCFQYYYYWYSYHALFFIFIVTDFVSKFAHVYESFAQELQSLVDVYKQKTTEYGKDIEG